MTVQVRPYRGSTDKWEFDIKLDLADGRKIRERRLSKYPTEAATLAYGKRREVELVKAAMAPEPKPESKASPTLRAFMPEYFKACEAERLSPATMALKRSGFKNWLLPVLGDVRLVDIDNAKFAKFKGSLASLGLDAAGNMISLLSAALYCAVEHGVLAAMPCKIKRVKGSTRKMPFYDFEQFDQLLEAAADEQRVMVLLGGHCGLRIGELVALEWPDIDFTRRVITVQRAVWQGRVGLPKHGKIREVSMSDTMVRALKAFRHLRGPRVFYQPNGKPVTAKLLRGWLREIEAAAGLEERGRAHQLRHTFCSHMALRGVPANVIMTLAGHHSLKVTMKYMHLAPNSAADAVRTFDQKPGDIRETRSPENVTA